MRWTALALVLAFVAGCGSEDTAPGVAVEYGLDGEVPGGAKPGTRRPNVLLVVIDTLRADALPADAGVEVDMPRLAARARKGAVCTNVSATSSWTLPSLTSVLTGVLPSAHRITSEEGLPTGLARLTTLAEVLGRGLGYETVAHVGGPWPARAGTMLEGFGSGSTGACLQGCVASLKAWHRGRDPRRPWFLLLHTYEAHDPYGAENHPFPAPPLLDADLERAKARLRQDPSGPAVTRAYALDRVAHDAVLADPELRLAFFRHMWDGPSDGALEQDLRSAYRQGVRWVDGLLEGVLQDFERLGLLDETVTIVTGDHGEAFGEHGMLLHGRRLDDELLRVPLVFLGLPDVEPGARANGSASLLDVMPTVLDVVGLPPMAGLPGRSLLPALRGEDQGRPAAAQVVRTPGITAGRSDALVESVRDDAWKLVLTLDRRSGQVEEEAFHLALDPGERRNLAVSGRAEGLGWSAEFCRAAEQARDRVWAARRELGFPEPGTDAGGPVRAQACAAPGR